MRRAQPCLAACAAFSLLSLVGSRALAQGELFTLAIEGPTEFSGNPGQTFPDQIYYPTLDHKSGPGPGAQGWSYGISINENLMIQSLTFAGTATAFLPDGFRDPDNAFNKTQIIDPAKNDGKNGMVSAVALTTGGLPEAVLPATGVQRLYRINLTATIPAQTGVGTLTYEAGLVGAGQPVDIVVTQNGVSAPFELVQKEVDLIAQVSTNCCDSTVNVGFSDALVRGGTPFQGIAGVGTMCTADQGQIIVPTAAGATGVKKVYPNIISELAAGTNVQGWSYGILVDGPGSITAQSAAGTATALLPEGFRDPDNAFNKTQIIDPAKNGGNKGLVSAVALTTGGLPEAILPSTGTETILCVDVTAGGPQGETDEVNTLSFEQGLIGAGQPVDLVVTVNGESAAVCNFLLAEVDVVFRQEGGVVGEPFRRGHVNPDGKFDIADGVYIINYLVRSGPEPGCLDAADVNDDGAVDVSDAMHAIFYLFQPGTAPNPDPAPMAPFTACGPDPTEDEVTCNTSPSICP
jgi:hypothetical protein